MKNNINKSKFLGMPWGTAMSRLRKIILFDLVKKINLDICYRCETKITSIDDFSIEHKKPWLGIDNKLFWDLDNIAFSHIICNCKARRKINLGGRKIKSPLGMSWCSICKMHKDINCFSFDSGKGGRNGRNKECKDCRRMRK